MGILLGNAHSDHITIERLVAPKQDGTPNEVRMLDDANLDILQLENGLVTDGWIHTHPTQPAFLRSIDMHAE